MRRFVRSITALVLLALGTAAIQIPLSLAACDSMSKANACCCPSGKAKESCPVIKKAATAPQAIEQTRLTISVVWMTAPIVPETNIGSAVTDSYLPSNNIDPPIDPPLAPPSLRAPPFLA